MEGIFPVIAVQPVLPAVDAESGSPYPVGEASGNFSGTGTVSHIIPWIGIPQYDIRHISARIRHHCRQNTRAKGGQSDCTTPGVGDCEQRYLSAVTSFYHNLLK